ncbi:MAG: ATP-dependent helicase, partial [Candidatus Sericytochromatia bacterium]
MKLNSEQQEAVSHTTGPLLILAGAGSGKTRVLTERIANLITSHKVLPYHILAVTFTNKASKEMKERIASRVGENVAKSLWVGTFHSICIRILRSEIELLGRKANFVVYDTTDQTKLISDILGKLNIDDKNFPANEVLRAISSAKSKALTAEKYSEFATSYKEQRIADIYLAYDLELKKNNALDFDDILLLVVRILEESPETLEYYQNKFKYILVDEYQDTNQVQYQLIKLLSDKYRNICAVGDVDQSIYAFRNADYRIILNFQNDYNDAKIIKLETNYRSTKNIVNLSNEIIKNNQQSFPKNLRTDNPFGDKTKIYEAYDDHSEASFIGNEIIRLVYSGNFDYDNFAILFRTNSQSRVFEKVLISNNIPYQVIGGFRFFERKEIKDLISYLKAIYNPDDNISLQRIINIPKRGIGDTTIKKLLDIADNYNISLWDVLNFQTFENISPATQSKIREFVVLLAELIDQSSTISVSALL